MQVHHHPSPEYARRFFAAAHARGADVLVTAWLDAYADPAPKHAHPTHPAPGPYACQDGGHVITESGPFAKCHPYFRAMRERWPARASLRPHFTVPVTIRLP